MVAKVLADFAEGQVEEPELGIKFEVYKWVLEARNGRYRWIARLPGQKVE